METSILTLKGYGNSRWDQLLHQLRAWQLAGWYYQCITMIMIVIICKQTCHRSSSGPDMLKDISMLQCVGRRETWLYKPLKGCSPISSVSTWQFNLTWGAGSRLVNIYHLPSSSIYNVIFQLHDNFVKECGRSYFPMMAEIVFPFPYVLELCHPSLKR